MALSNFSDKQFTSASPPVNGRPYIDGWSISGTSVSYSVNFSAHTTSSGGWRNNPWYVSIWLNSTNIADHRKVKNKTSGKIGTTVYYMSGQSSQATGTYNWGSSGGTVKVYAQMFDNWTYTAWTKNVWDWTTYAVYYAANGGSSTPGTQTKYSGTALTLASAISHADGTANGYTVTFDANGGSVSPTTKTATDTIGYSFSSWKADNGTTYSGGGSYTTDAATTMTAQWSTSVKTRGSITTPSATRGNGTSTRTVTFDATTNGGTCSTSSLNSTATVTYSSNGWYTATSGGTQRCVNGGSYTPSASETVHAQWSSSTGTFSAITLPSATKANGSSTRTVTINANGGSSTVSSRTSTATVTYSCSGWFTAASGGTKRGAVAGTYTPSASEKIYAQFTSSTGSYSAVTLPTTSECTRTYYTLLGFSTSDTATTATYSPGASYTPDASRILYAVWQLNAPTAASISISSTVRDKITVSVGYTGAGLSNYTVYYRANSTGTYSSQSLGTSASGTITGLQPNTPYQLYVTATNAAGSVNSSTTTTTTKAYIPKVNIPVVSNLEAEQATITVSATGDTNAGITNYTLYKAVAPNLNKNLYDMPLKVMSDNSLWARIFYHNCKEGTVLFTSLAEAKNTQTADKYSRMYLLEDDTYKINGKFEFMLCYPEYSSTLYNRWKQTNAPQNEYITRVSTGGQVTGYEAVHIDWTNNYWGGLERFQADATAFATTWLDGSVGHGNWFYAIGAASTHGDGIPSYSSTFGSVELWIRVGDITGWSTTNLGTSTSTTWTPLTEQTDYIVWVSATNAGGVTTGPSLVFTTPIGQATVWVKVNGTWVKGKVWYKNSSGTWVKCKKFYTKSGGSWIENKTTS